MGKKVMMSEAAIKVSKNNEKKKPQPHQQHLHGLIKVLKPKVYITDASSFKRLVQELTGNASPNPSAPSSPDLPPLMPEDRVQTSCPETVSEGWVQVQASPPLRVEDQDHHRDSWSTRVEVQAPTSESSQITGNADLHSGLLGLEELVGLEELESWLLEDVDHMAVPFCESSYNFDQQQELSFYNYGFSGML